MHNIIVNANFIQSYSCPVVDGGCRSNKEKDDASSPHRHQPPAE
jgi:hypothetical protein